MRLSTLLALLLSPIGVWLGLSSLGHYRVDRFVEEKYAAFVARYGTWEAAWGGPVLDVEDRVVVKVDETVKEGVKEILNEHALSFAFGIDEERAFNTLHKHLLSLYDLSDSYTWRGLSVRLAHPDTIFSRYLFRISVGRSREGFLCNTLTSALGSAYALIFQDTLIEVVGLHRSMYHVVLVKDSTAFTTSPPAHTLRRPLSEYWKAGWGRIKGWRKKERLH